MFDKFTSLEHLHNSFIIAYIARKKTKEVICYKQNLEDNLLNLRNNLLDFTYRHRKYKTFIVEDSKKRIINAPSFEDHILHHAIFSFLENIYEKKFVENSFANRKGKGSHSAVLKLQKQSKKYSWFLKLDITKYFQSIDQEILFEQIKRHVTDENFLFYVKMVIQSYTETNIENLLTKNSIGMPIGNVTSQLFANIYLHDLDFYIETELKPLIRKFNRNIFYIRYVDDFILLAKYKQDLVLLKKYILEFLAEKPKLSVSPRKLVLNKVECGIPFLGYNILTSKKTKIVSRIDGSNCCYKVFRHKLKIRNDTIRRFKKRIKKYSDEKKINSLISFKGHCDLANKKLIFSISSHVLTSKYISPKLISKLFLSQNFTVVTELYESKNLISVLCMKRTRETNKRNSQ
jgi:retron-type reverse transcriptase